MIKWIQLIKTIIDYIDIDDKFDVETNTMNKQHTNVWVRVKCIDIS